MRGLSLTLLIPAALIAFGSHGFAAQPPVADDPLPPPANRKVDFAKDIKPLLVKHCISCHGAKKQESGFRVDTHDATLAGGDRGVAFEVGESATSLLIRYVG